MELFDSHAHYDDEKFNEDRDEIIKAIYESGITKCVSAGYSIESSKKGIELAEKYNFIYTTCGISPNDLPETFEELEEALKEVEILAMSSDKVVAIGEIGLDYYWNKDNKELQLEAFKRQIEIANKLNLPIQIHTRDAIMDTIDIISKTEFVKPGIFHCCPQNKDLITAGLKKDFFISFGGPITFKNSKNADEMIGIIPIDHQLIETDSPYLSPEPNRGKRNDSRNVKYVAEKIANVKNMTIDEVAKITFENAKRAFGIN